MGSTGQAHHTLVMHICTIGYLLQMPSMDDIITNQLRVLFHMLRNSVENFCSPSLGLRLLRLIIPYSEVFTLPGLIHMDSIWNPWNPWNPSGIPCGIHGITVG